jgi:hypothetical protein
MRVPPVLMLVLLSACKSATTPAPDGGPVAATTDAAANLGAGTEPWRDPVNGAQRGGTRLRPVGWSGGGSAILYAPEWKDTQLGVDCRFTAASDGNVYCVPSQAAHIQGGVDYADAACTAPLYFQSSGSDAPDAIQFGVREALDACPSRFVIYRDLGPFTGQQFQRDATGCHPGTGQTGPRRRFVADASLLVPMQVTPGKSAGGLTPLYLDGADGSHAFWSWRDDASGKHCMFFGYSHVGDRAFCVPEDRATVDSCGGQTAEAPIGCEAGVSLAVGLNSCSGEATVRAVAGPGNEPFCAGVTFGSHFSVDAPVAPPQQLLASPTMPSPGSTRLRLRGVETAAGSQAISFWDSRLQEDCFPGGINTTPRCLPAMNGCYSDSYADPQCTHPVAAIERASLCTTRRWVAQTLAQAPTLPTIYRLKGPLAGPYYVKIGDSCTPGNDTLVSYEIDGPPVPLTDFVEIQLMPWRST